MCPPIIAVRGGKATKFTQGLVRHYLFMENGDNTDRKNILSIVVRAVRVVVGHDKCCELSPQDLELSHAHTTLNTEGVIAGYHNAYM